MGIRLPSSRVFTRFRFAPVDVAWAALAPALALYLRNPFIHSTEGVSRLGLYCLVSLVCALIAFAALRVHIGLPRYLSAHDIVDLTKAVALGEFISCLVVFSLTRLNGVPRSTPAIHALLLWSGLVAVRVVLSVADRRRSPAPPSPPIARENVVLIGVNDLSAFFLRSLHRFGGDQRRVIALLDIDPRWISRAVQGVAVLGQPRHLDAVVEEFGTHGVRTDRVVITSPRDLLSPADLAEVERVCAERNLELEFAAQPFPLRRTAPAAIEPRAVPLPPPTAPVVPSSFFMSKRLVDVAAALVLIIALSPLWSAAALLTWLLIGSPIFFWQQRVGRGGQDFDLYKLRTLSPPVDRNGRRVDEAERLSWVGRLLRHTRADELPQLLNVLVGDMSLVGPRPLLPHDQPKSPAGRLMVRPGVTGWAQVNGGNALTPSEKQALDEWYIRNATLWLDLRIALMTFASVIRGDRRNERALALARAAPNVAGPFAGELPQTLRPSELPGTD